MNEESRRLVQALLEPHQIETLAANSELMARVLQLAGQSGTGERLFYEVAQGSLTRARAVLELLRPNLSWFYAGEIKKAIDRVEEEQEYAALLNVSSEDLKAHFVILALLPADAPETQLRERVLVRALARSNPKQAAERTHGINLVYRNDRDFWTGLRRDLFLRFRDTEPEHAVHLLDEVPDGWNWYLALITHTAPSGKLCVSVLERLLTVAFPARLSVDELMELALYVSRSTLPERVAMLHALIRRVHFPMPAERPALLQAFLRAARTWTPQEQQAILAVARKDALCYLVGEDRTEALQKLAI